MPQIAPISATWELAIEEKLKFCLLVLPRPAFIALSLQYMVHIFVSILLSLKPPKEGRVFCFLLVSLTSEQVT